MASNVDGGDIFGGFVISSLILGFILIVFGPSYSGDIEAMRSHLHDVTMELEKTNSSLDKISRNISTTNDALGSGNHYSETGNLIRIGEKIVSELKDTKDQLKEINEDLGEDHLYDHHKDDRVKSLLKDLKMLLKEIKREKAK